MEVVRRDDEVVKLAQVAPLIGQLVHAVVVHGGLTPHTPGGGGGLKNQNLAWLGGSSRSRGRTEGGLERICVRLEGHATASTHALAHSFMNKHQDASNITQE